MLIGILIKFTSSRTTADKTKRTSGNFEINDSGCSPSKYHGRYNLSFSPYTDMTDIDILSSKTVSLLIKHLLNQSFTKAEER